MRIYRRLFSFVMHHLLIAPNREGIFQASQLIKSGKLVAFPTETVYGLGANALDADAVRSIFTAKGRPLTDPLIVHVAKQQSSDELVDLTSSEKMVFDALSTAFWPGPLTLIVKASSKIPMIVTANTGFVGIRVPRHPLAVALLEASGLPIAAPSANRFGHVSPTTAAHVLADLGEKDVHILNGEDTGAIEFVDKVENCEFGIESSVVKIDEANRQLIIFRQGAISQAQLESCLRSLSTASGSALDWKVVAVQRAVKMHSTDAQGPAAAPMAADTDASERQQEIAAGQQAPGQAITHYAPDVPCVIVRSLEVTDGIGAGAGASATSTAATPQLQVSALPLTRQQCAAECVVIDFGGQLSALRENALAYRDLSPSGSAAEGARHLFDTLRWAESVPGAGRVLVASIPSCAETLTADVDADGNLEPGSDMSLGLTDRIFRAASGVAVDVCLLP